jgi:hypothetical protein
MPAEFGSQSVADTMINHTRLTAAIAARPASSREGRHWPRHRRALQELSTCEIKSEKPRYATISPTVEELKSTEIRTPRWFAVVNSHGPMVGPPPLIASRCAVRSFGPLIRTATVRRYPAGAQAVQ